MTYQGTRLSPDARRALAEQHAAHEAERGEVEREKERCRAEERRLFSEREELLEAKAAERRRQHEAQQEA
jgi:hypothetical protein